MIVFKGCPRPPPEDESWEDVVANRRLSVSFLAISPVYKKNRQFRRNGGGRRGFQMGFRDEEEKDNSDHRGGGMFSNRSLAGFMNGSVRSDLEDQDPEENDPLFQYIRKHKERVEKGEEEESEKDEEDKAGPRSGPRKRSRRATVVESDEEEEESDVPKPDLPFDPDKGPSGEFIRKQFRVGRHCSARLMLYHGLFHWKHRLLARLKKELKSELRRRKVGNLFF